MRDFIVEWLPIKITMALIFVGYYLFKDNQNNYLIIPYTLLVTLIIGIVFEAFQGS